MMIGIGLYDLNFSNNRKPTVITITAMGGGSESQSPLELQA